MSHLLRVPQGLHLNGMKLGASSLTQLCHQPFQNIIASDRDHHFVSRNRDMQAIGVSGSSSMRAELSAAWGPSLSSTTTASILTTMQQHARLQLSPVNGSTSHPSLPVQQFLLHPFGHLSLMLDKQHAASQQASVPLTPFEAPSVSEDIVQLPTVQDVVEPVMCKVSRGCLWQPSRRKRVNKHGIEKRCVDSLMHAQWLDAQNHALCLK